MEAAAACGRIPLEGVPPRGKPVPDQHDRALKSKQDAQPSDDESDQPCEVGVIIHSGTGWVQAGYCGDAAPRCVFPNVTGALKNPVINIGDGPRVTRAPGSSANMYAEHRDYYIGDEAVSKRGVLHLKFPVSLGIVQDWDRMEAVWHHTFYAELRVRADEQPVLMTEPPLNPKANREKMAEICLGVLGAPALCVASEAVLCLRHALGTGDVCCTGLVVTSGQDITNVVPIVDGCVVQHAVQSFDISGHDLDRYMAELLAQRGLSFYTSAEQRMVRDMKETLAYVAPKSLQVELEREDLAHEFRPRTLLGNTTWMMDPDDPDDRRRFDYELPDGQIVRVGDLSCRCPEPMFNPALLGLIQHGSLPLHVYRAAMACGITGEKTPAWPMLHTVVLSGGNTLFDGMRERMERELRQLAGGDLQRCAAERRLAFGKLLQQRLVTMVPTACFVDVDVVHAVASMVLPAMEHRVSVVAPQYRRYSAWIGGSMLLEEWVEGAEVDKRCLSQEAFKRTGCGGVHSFFLG